MGSTRKRFTEEYKLHAVELVVSEGWSYREAAIRLEITESTLRNWVKKLDTEPKETTDLEAEMKELRKKNKLLEKELAFSKKVAAWLATLPPE